MAEALTEKLEMPARNSSRLPLVLGLALFAAMAVAGFAAVRQGVIPGLAPADATLPEDHAITPLPDISFVPIEPLIINLGETAGSRYLRFQAQLEVNDQYSADVTRLMPRIVDVLNGYLRAVDLRDLQDRSAIVRLRAQMLRRVQLVVGAGRVRDLLITEFVVN